MNTKTHFRKEDLSGLMKYFTEYRSRCICCNANSTNFIRWDNSEFKTDKCKNCGIVFMNPYMHQSGLNLYYSNYLTNNRQSNPHKMKLRHEQYKIDAEVVKRFQDSGKILDVGCNGGFFLNTISKDLVKYGIELDDSSIAYARNNFPEFGNNITDENLEDLVSKNKKFDGVIMRGVIEHYVDPVSAIENVSKILETSGYFYIFATPNIKSFAAEVYRDKWTLFHPVQHVFHFSADNLETICNRYGLSLVWKEFPYLDTPYEDVANDLSAINKAIKDRSDGIEPGMSKAFYENMLTLVFQKKN